MHPLVERRAIMIVMYTYRSPSPTFPLSDSESAVMLRERQFRLGTERRGNTPTDKHTNLKTHD